MNLIMQMGSGGAAGVSEEGYLLTPLHILALFDKDLGHVSVYGLQAVVVVDLKEPAIAIGLAHRGYYTVHRGNNRGIHLCADVQSGMELLLIGKRRYAVSEPGHHGQWDGEIGFIHESVDRHLSSKGTRQAFLCGPPPMIEAVMKVLDAKGVSRDRIFYDEF